MNAADFAQARHFISTDIGREIELARRNGNGEFGLPIAPGGGNLLAALGLLCYTEFGGKLRFGYKKRDGTDASKKNFLAFFELLGPTYATFARSHDVYGVFRCGLAHEYYVKKTCRIAMLSNGVSDGISATTSGAYTFVVEAYFHALMRELDALHGHLFPATP